VLLFYQALTQVPFTNPTEIQKSELLRPHLYRYRLISQTIMISYAFKLDEETQTSISFLYGSAYFVFIWGFQLIAKHF